MEIWKDIKIRDGIFLGKYQVSNKGRVKSLVRPGVLQERILTRVKTKKGYRRVAMWGAKKAYFHLVHRLVLEAFLGEDERQVNHIDRNKENNNLENLEFVTPLEHSKHSMQSPDYVVMRGDLNGRSILRSDIVAYIKYYLVPFSGFNLREIGDLYGVSPSTINDIKHSRTWKHI